MSLTSAAHAAELQRFADLLSKEAHETQVLPAAEAVPYETLLVRIETFEEENRVWSLEISFLAGLENEMDDVSILQCFVALSDQISEEHRSSLNELIVRINAKLPVGGFGLLDDPRLLFFKHNALLPDDSPDASYKIVHELVSMTAYLISSFSEPLIRVATGQKTIGEAIVEMPFSNQFGRSD